jgi:RNA-splicing ligase RtcB
MGWDVPIPHVTSWRSQSWIQQAARRDQAIVDEIPGAYKDLHSVIDVQKDLVDVIQHLRTDLCVKG